MNNLSQRYLSLDVLRGLTVTLMIIVNSPGNWGATYAPLLHATWHGFTATDLVFPTFLFAVGNALSFTLGRYESIGQSAVLKKIFTRTALIFLLGFLMYWFPFFKENGAGQYILSPLGETRIFGVLQRIALAYCFAALILYYWKTRGAIIFSAAALLGYWAIMYSFGDYSLNGNAGLIVDRFVVGEHHMYRGEGIAFDPEGILSTLPAIVNVLAGYFAGSFIKKNGASYETIAKLMMAGVVCIFLAVCWDSVFPINKKLWTSSYVLLTVGLGLLILPMLMFVIEILQFRRWTYFFEVFGKNTLFIFLLSELGVVLLFTFHAGDKNLYGWIYSSIFQPLAGDYNGSLLFALSVMLICWSIGYFLDKKKIYIKV